MEDFQLRYLGPPSPWPRHSTPSPVNSHMPMLGSTIQNDSEPRDRLFFLQMDEGQEWDPNAFHIKLVSGRHSHVGVFRFGGVRTVLPWAGEIVCCLLGMVAMVGKPSQFFLRVCESGL